MSTILAIASSSGPASVALARGGAVVAEELSHDPRGHVEFLMPAISRVCPDLREVTAVAVDIGPGAFSGLRAGVATAKALAHTLGVPVVPVGGLAVLSARAPGAWAVADAGRGRVYACAPGGEPELLDAAELAERVGDARLIGDASAEALQGCDWVERVAIQARDIAAAARGRDGVPPAQVEPLYLRGAGRAIDWEGRGAVIERPDRVKIAGER